MANGLYADPSVIDQKGRSTMNLAVDLKSEIDSLTANKDNLMSIWKGQAANAFESATANQLTNLENFKDLLNEMGEKIVQGANTFSTNEEENTNMAANLYMD